MSLTSFTTMDGIAPMSEWRTIKWYRSSDNKYLLFMMHNGNDRMKIHFIKTNEFELWMTLKNENEENIKYSYRMWNFLEKSMRKKLRAGERWRYQNQKRRAAKEILLKCFSKMHGIYWDFDYLREDKAKDIEYAMTDMFEIEVFGLMTELRSKPNTLSCKNCGHEIKIIQSGCIIHKFEKDGRCCATLDYPYCRCYKPERE